MAQTTSSLAFCVLASAFSGSFAAEPEPAAPAASGAAATLLEPVRVTAKPTRETATSPVVGYRAKNAATATKTDTPLLETPQSVTVITRDQITDQGATGLQEALNYAAGVRSDAYGLDSRSDGVRIRGAAPDEYLDGLRKLFGYYTSNARTDPYSLERIEVLRGPSAMLYGQGSTGGVINMVSKRPLAEAEHEIGLQYGSHDRRQFQADFTGPLTADGRWLYRLVAVARESGTQVDHVSDDRVLIAPSLTWRPTPATTLTLQALYQKDKSGSTSQFFPWAGVLTPNPNGQLPTSRFIGDPDWDHYDSERSSLGYLFEHRFDSGWTIRQNLRYSRNTVDYRTLYADSFSLPGDWVADPVNKRLIGRFGGENLTRAHLLDIDQHVEGRFATGAVSHQVLAGVDLSRLQQTDKASSVLPDYYGGTVPLIDAYDPVYPAFTPPELADLPDSFQRQTGLYLQDQMRLDDWIVTAGLRHDRAVNGTDGADDQSSRATTKRIGLLYAASNGLSPYLSYSESFTPVGNIGAQSFVPLRGKQWEAGVKYEPSGRDLAFNAAVYELREQNQVVEVVPDFYEQLDETKANGVELELKAAVTRNIDVTAHYNYTDLDDKLENEPRHQAGAWARWKFAIASIDGFSAGAGVRWMSSFHDGAAPTVPTLTLFDAMVAWDSPRWRYALNVSNLADKTYVSTCLSRGDCWYGARRNIVGTATYKF